MDTADRVILKTLAKNGRTPIKVLAEKVFLSSPAVSARVDRLEKSGLIESYQAQLNPKALGYDFMAYINLAFQPEHRGEIEALLSSCPNILECHHVTGPYNLLMRAVFTSTAEMERFVTHLQTYGSTQTQIVFSTLIGPRQPIE